MLRLNLMARSQATELVQFLCARLASVVRVKGVKGPQPGKVRQKDIAPIVHLSPAWISKLIEGTETGMNLETAENIAGYFRLPLVDAMQAALAGAAPAPSGETDLLRESALRRLAGHLAPETVNEMRAVAPEPGRVYVEWDWIKLAVEREGVRRQMLPVASADAAKAEALVAGAHGDIVPEARGRRTRSGKRAASK